MGRGAKLRPVGMGLPSAMLGMRMSELGPPLRVCSREYVHYVLIE
jgi:hypothetical protein